MPIPVANPTRDKCIDVAGRIVCAVIESGKLSTEAEEVGKYFNEIYRIIYRSALGKVN